MKPSRYKQQWPKPTKTTVAQAVTYKISFDDGFGWIVASVSDETGLFSISSDWGDWSYAWSPRHITGTLHEFLAKTSAHYVGGKMLDRKEDSSFDIDATQYEFVKEILAMRRDKTLDRDEAREAYDDAKAAEREDEFYKVPHMHTEPWDLFQFTPTAKYWAFHECVFPAIQAAIRERLAAPATFQDATQ